MISQKAIEEMIGTLRREPIKLANGQTLQRGAPKPADLERAAALLEQLATPSLFYAIDLDEERMIASRKELDQTARDIETDHGLDDDDRANPFKVNCWAELEPRWAIFAGDGVELYRTRELAAEAARVKIEAEG